MSRKEMRALGYRVIDMLVEHFDMLPTRPVMHIGKRADLEERLREPLPEKATDVSSVINQLREDVLNHIFSCRPFSLFCLRAQPQQLRQCHG
jgi:aromatic-L-amino-acid/L-tryptophan decarboxylase